MKIHVSESSFYDPTRVGYDYSYASCYLVEDSKSQGGDIDVPSDLSDEQVKMLCDEMNAYLEKGYGAGLSFDLALAMVKKND